MGLVGVSGSGLGDVKVIGEQVEHPDKVVCTYMALFDGLQWDFFVTYNCRLLLYVRRWFRDSVIHKQGY